MLNMTKDIRCLLLVLFTGIYVASAQEPASGSDYQTTLISNPAVTGSEGNGIIRLSYRSLYPGNGFDLHSVSLSYDGYFPSLHGGAGFFISDNYLGGIVNDLRGGFSYAYFFRAAGDLYLSAGLSASVYNRGFNTGGAVLPDQIDPLRGALLPAGEIITSRGKTIFDLGTGFMFISGRFLGGISVTHLTEPDLSITRIAGNRLNRTLLIHVASGFDIGRGKNLKIRPAGKFEMQKGFISVGAGAAFESNYLSINSLLFIDNEKSLDIQTGFAINTGIIVVYYNYRFNIVSGNNLLPFSLLHQTGIAFSLNYVDKRKTIKTINFPKL